MSTDAILTDSQQQRLEQALRPAKDALHRFVIGEQCKAVFRKRKAAQWVATQRYIEAMKGK